MISRKQVQAHINSKLYIRHLDLDVFVIDCHTIKIVGRGIQKTFKSNRAAKAWVTRIDNAELCKRVDASMSAY